MRRAVGEVEVSVIVVTHAARDVTLACFASLAADAAAIRSEVIVVDNASSDGLAGEIAALYPDFCLLSQVGNLGFAVAANVGADQARGRYLLFLNPDTILSGGTLTRLVEFALTNRRAAPVGPRTNFASGAINPTCCRRKPTLWRLLCSGLGLDTRFSRSGIFGGLGYRELPDSGAHVVDVVCGVCLLVERSVWDRLGGFSPAFFMYGEDDDFCLRARRIGYLPTVACGVAIVHHGSGTERNQVRKLCQILAARSLVIRAYLARPARPIGRALLLLRPFAGKYIAKREVRPFWQNVWTKRRQWLSGRFA